MLINLLPNTAETAGIINQTLLAQLPDESYVLNLARGVHVVEEDLLAALNSGKPKGAMLDVFSREPLPAGEPAMGASAGGHDPHVAAARPMEAITYIAETISRQAREIGKRSERPPALIIKTREPRHGGVASFLLFLRQTKRGECDVSRYFTYAVASTHAYSTLHDYIAEAKRKGIKLFAITDRRTWRMLTTGTSLICASGPAWCGGITARY